MSFLHKSFLNTMILGKYRDDIENFSPKIYNNFSMEERFQVKLFCRSYEWICTGLILKQRNLKNFEKFFLKFVFR